MICDDCANRFTCVFDGKVERTECGLYLSEINPIEAFMELLKNYVTEKRRAEKNGNLDCWMRTDGGADRDAGAGVPEAGEAGRAEARGAGGGQEAR